MDTMCPIISVGALIAVSMGLTAKERAGHCLGPSCQLWQKCRKPNQCPECGKTGSWDDNNSRFACPTHGWFYKD